jgi:hypothetical protein
VDGEPVAELGPGALLGERALLEHGRGRRRCGPSPPCTVAVAGADDIDRTALEALSEGHRREDAAT